MTKGKLLRIVSPVLVLALVFSLVSVFLMPKPAAAAPAEVWVDENYCDGCPNDGHTWGTDAFAKIQDGIDAVASPGTVHVAAGDYVENIVLEDGVQLLGAGAGVTTIDGRGAGSVVTATGVGPDTVLDGFTITNGSAEWGGGMYNLDHSSPKVTNCIFSGNSAGKCGGGMCNDWFSSPTVTNCTFDNNDAARGGGMCNDDYSSATVANCRFSGNWADYQGGGMCNWDSWPTVANCIFDDNSAGEYGGGMYNFYSSPTVANCTFSGNSAGKRGGGMCNWFSSPTVTSCIVDNNSASDCGGGMYNMDGSSPTVANCIFSGNSAGKSGGGMCNDWHSSATVTSCTFSGNSATINGSAMYNDESSPTVTNCILWDTGEEIANDDSSPSVTYCDVQGDYPGEGNIDADPMFVDPAGGDYRLEAGSPCIDVGSNTAVPGWLSTDFEGHPRIWDGNGDGESIVDMGAYEYFTWTLIFQDPATGTELRVSPGDKSFQFIAPGYDSGIVEADSMVVLDFPSGQFIFICHSDSEISLFAFAADSAIDFCIAFVRAMETGQRYFLFD